MAGTFVSVEEVEKRAIADSNITGNPRTYRYEVQFRAKQDAWEASDGFASGVSSASEISRNLRLGSRQAAPQTG